MKVWELMVRLAECAAGAEVEVSTLITANQLQSGDIIDKDDNGEDLYHVHGKVAEVADDGQIVLLMTNE